MKNNGISLITLIITIVVIIILASFTIYYGLIKNVDESTNTKIVYEVHEIIDAVTNRSLLNDLNSKYYMLVGDELEDDIEIIIDGKPKIFKSSDGWLRVNKESHFEELGLTNMTGDYIVNYNNGSVFSVNGVMYKDVVYYSMNDLRQVVGGGSTILSKAEYDNEKGVNAPVLSQGMIPVKLQGSNWVVTTSDDNEWYDYSETMAWANVMLVDELVVEGYTNEEVRNASISELAGKTVVREGSSYVWIPRYTSTNVGGSDSKIIFSNLTNDITEANGETYQSLGAFTFSEGNTAIELTGIWVSKYVAGFSN